MMSQTESNNSEELPLKEGGNGDLSEGAQVQKDEVVEHQENSQENPQLVHRKKKAKKTMKVKEEFSCPVCLHLVALPTTLTCGHTSCRLCLAKWYFNSKKKECPLCRLSYHGHPQVNTQIKNLLETLSPDTVHRRERELEEDERNQDILSQYDEELSHEDARVPEQVSDVTSFCSGIIVALLFCVVAYLAWYWQSADSSLLVNKPVQAWKPRDVVSWLEELGWAAQYTKHVEEHQIDGTMLLAFDEKGLCKYLNISDETHYRALMLGIKVLNETGLKPPVNLWEFKAIYPGKALFLIYGLKGFPRTTLLYAYVYFYEDLFLPFLQATTGAGVLSQYSDTKMEDPSTAQWVYFVVCTMVVPRWLVAVFAWQMFQHHVFTPLFVLASTIFCTVLEVLDSLEYVYAQERRWLFIFDARALVGMLWSYLQQMLVCFGVMVLWPLVPTLVCDSLFYATLYLGPLHTSRQFYDKLQEYLNRDIRQEEYLNRENMQEDHLNREIMQEDL